MVAGNKVDRRGGGEGGVECWALGFPEVYGVSAEHSIGVDDLQTVIGAAMDAAGSKTGASEEALPGDHEIALAVVGRPNVGKSSLLNALLGEERAIVSETAGTTRDSVDATFEAAGPSMRVLTSCRPTSARAGWSVSSKRSPFSAVRSIPPTKATRSSKTIVFS